MAGETGPEREARTGSRGLCPRTGGLRGGADRGVDDDRLGWLLSFQESPRRAVFVLLRPLHRRPDGKLRLCRYVLDLGKRRQEELRELGLDARPDEREGT